MTLVTNKLIAKTARWVSSPNFRKARNREISAIVIHYTGSMHIDGTVTWFQNPDSRVSAHYLIGREGELVQMVRDEDIAWHAGRSALHGESDAKGSVNSFTLGIELIGTHDKGFTVKQLSTLYRLLEKLVVQYDIPHDRVVGHCHVAPTRKIDPDGYNKQFPWSACHWVVKQARKNATLHTEKADGRKEKGSAVQRRK